MYDEESTLQEKVYYYVHTLLAVFFFLFVADKIMNWFQPGYVVHFQSEWSKFWQIFAYSYAMIKKLVFFIFKLPEIILKPIYR